MIWTAPSEKDTTTIGFEGDSRPFTPRHAKLVIPSATWQHVIHRHTPQTAVRGSAISQRKASPQVLNAAKDNVAGVDSVCLRSASAVLANGSMSSNHSGDCPARRASLKPKAKPQNLPRQRDIRRALIEADLVDTAVRDSAFFQSEAIPQVVSQAKNNMVALPGQFVKNFGSN
jgi:hypothetical protein